jgi:hypothetical protein
MFCGDSEKGGVRIDENCQLVQGGITSDRKEDHDAFLC